MSNLKRRTTRWGSISILVSAAVMILSACAGQPVAISTAAPMQTADSEITQAPTAGATVTDAPIPTETAGVVEISFARDVLPILMSRCLNCHGGQKTEKGFNITSYDHLMAGSEKGPAVVVGDAANSKLVQLIEQGKMPKRGPKVLPDQLAILINWINAGALNN